MSEPDCQSRCLTVAELIDALAGQPKDAEVWIEGCDCIGGARGVELQESGSVLITRD